MARSGTSHDPFRAAAASVGGEAAPSPAPASAPASASASVHLGRPRLRRCRHRRGCRRLACCHNRLRCASAQPVSPDPTGKRSSGEEQWFLAKQTRKAAKLRLDETASAAQELAVERDAVVKRFDRQQAAAEFAFKDAKRRMSRSQAAMRSLSELMFDAEE